MSITAGDLAAIRERMEVAVDVYEDSKTAYMADPVELYTLVQVDMPRLISAVEDLARRQGESGPDTDSAT